MSDNEPAQHVPKIASGMVLPVVVWSIDAPVQVALIGQDGVLVELTPDAATELGRSLLTTAAQAMEAQAFLEFLIVDFTNTTNISAEGARGAAIALITAYLAWRAEGVTAKYEQRRGKKVKTS